MYFVTPVLLSDPADFVKSLPQFRIHRLHFNNPMPKDASNIGIFHEVGRSVRVRKLEGRKGAMGCPTVVRVHAPARAKEKYGGPGGS